MTALKWTFKSNKGEIYKLEKMESMEWQKQGSDALGDARQKLIHIRAPIVHYSEPYYSDGGGDDDSEMMMMVILTTLVHVDDDADGKVYRALSENMSESYFQSEFQFNVYWTISDQIKLNVIKF